MFVHLRTECWISSRFARLSAEQLASGTGAEVQRTTHFIKAFPTPAPKSVTVRIRGKAEALDVGHEAVFAHRCEYEGGAVIACHNLADQPARITVRLDCKAGEQLADLLGGRGDTLSGPGMALELPPYGYRWFRVVGGKWRDR
jgi:hypothetical protein